MKNSICCSFCLNLTIKHGSRKLKTKKNGTKRNRESKNEFIHKEGQSQVTCTIKSLASFGRTCLYYRDLNNNNNNSKSNLFKTLRQTIKRYK